MAWRFGRFELRPLERRLLLDRQPVELGARAFDVLQVLVEQRERIVSRNELLDRVWPGLVVEDNNLTVQIGSLRKLLGGAAISTVPGRGYRFTMALHAEDGSAAPPRIAPPPAVPGRSPLIGRANDIQALTALLDAERLVTIVGACGVGKTALARALTAGVQGVHWIDLAALQDARGLPAVVAVSLGTQLGRGGTAASLAAALASARVRIVLDNAEHVVDAVAELAHGLLAEAPGVRLLVTSQTALRVPGECVYRLGGLPVPGPEVAPAQARSYGALALFVDRARAAKTDFALADADLPAACAICRALDGSALAIELAAARVPLLGVPALARALDDRLHLLTRGGRTAPARQQSLRAALEWSHALLDEPARTVFRRLAVCAGAADLDLIERAVCDESLDRWRMLDALGDLVDRSLVALAGDDAAGRPRYRLLESPRALALEKLAGAADGGEARQRHARAIAERWQAAWATRYDGSIGLDAWAQALEDELDEARAAFSWAVAHDAAAAASIGATLMRRMHLVSGAAVAAIALPLWPLLEGDAVPPLLRARVLHEAATHPDVLAAAERRRAIERALQLFDDSGDTLGSYFCVGQLAVLQGLAGEVKEAAASIERLHALEDAAWPPQRLRVGASYEAAVAARFGDTARAVACGRRAVRLDAAAGLAHGMARSDLIGFELAAGSFELAIEEGLALLASMHDADPGRVEAMARANIVMAALQRPDPALARSLAFHPKGWQAAQRLGMQGPWGAALALLAAVEGRPADAAWLSGYASGAYDRAGRYPLLATEARALASARASAGAALDGATCSRLESEGAVGSDARATETAFGDGATIT